MKSNDKPEPIYNFKKLKDFLRSRGFSVGEAQGYRKIKIETVNLNSPSCDLEIASNGFFVKDPIDNVRRQVFLYMQDYRVSYYNKYPVYHVVNCQTLQTYSRAYYRKANTAKVLVRDRDTGEEVEVESLDLCKNCAEMLMNAPRTTEDFERIMRAAAEKSQNNGYKEEELDIFGYTKDWKDISDTIRAKRDYTCEKCGVHVDDPYDYAYIQVHHINGIKTNNNESNLQCLCIKCHSEVNDVHRKNFSTKGQQLRIREFVDKYMR